jgi:hypothetical protein
MYTLCKELCAEKLENLLRKITKGKRLALVSISALKRRKLTYDQHVTDAKIC